MAKRRTGLNPLAYGGVNATSPPNVIEIRRAPLPVDNTGFNIGDIWIHDQAQNESDAYILVGLASKVAKWVKIGESQGTVETLTGDTGGAVSPDNGNINIVGANGITVDGDIGSNTMTVTGSVSEIKVTNFTTDGTWTKDARALSVRVYMWGGGGGGGSGRRGLDTFAGGGSGGAGGALFVFESDAVNLSATEDITVGLGGTGGAAQTSDATNGNNGVAGNSSLFGTFLQALGGLRGTGGTIGNITGGGNSSSQSALDDKGGVFTAGSGGTGMNAAPGDFPADIQPDTTNSWISCLVSSGGGGGGGANSGANFAGGRGGRIRFSVFGSFTEGGTAGVSDGAAGGTGVAGTNIVGFFSGGSGGGGGGGQGTVAPSNGGNGGTRSGGGGGGGGSINGTNSGAGGAGGRGEVIVVEFLTS